jgi:H+/Cl- antiporter ClcA
MDFFRSKQTTGTRSFPILCMVIILIGITSGLAGMSLAMLLHYIQHIAYGYSLNTIISNESFLEGVRASSSARRIIVLTSCGVIAGGGWWLIYHYGKPLVGIPTAVNAKKPQMPIGTTIAHVLLQIITIALGSPLGREVAPRELSAIIAGWFCAKAGLSLRDTQIMLACGAGAGLAAVYNVPLGGAMYALEVLLCTLRWTAVLPALATSAIAVVVSWSGLGNVPQYYILNYSISYSLVTWAIVMGPIFGFGAYWFFRIATLARNKMQSNWQLPVLCLLNFVIIGLLALYFPSLLGNGKSPAQLEFDDQASLGLTAILLILRTLITWSSLRAGAQGGLLTPSLADGALLGVVLGGLWNLLWPGSPLGAYAIIGAAAFLGAAQRMPITAIILIFEFTRINFNFLIPILFGVTGSVGMYSLCANTLFQSNRALKQ